MDALVSGLFSSGLSGVISPGLATDPASRFYEVCSSVGSGQVDDVHLARSLVLPVVALVIVQKVHPVPFYGLFCHRAFLVFNSAVDQSWYDDRRANISTNGDFYLLSFFPLFSSSFLSPCRGDPIWEQWCLVTVTCLSPYLKGFPLGRMVLLLY